MISVIVPIYNVEPYLGRCIDSILRSDHADFELILVDDGSTDGCFRICEEYAAQDPRVRVLSQENRGVSAARNRGLEVCRGEWVVFVDADDCISPDHLSLIAGAEDADLLLFDFAENPEELTAAVRSGEIFRYGPSDIPDLAERILIPRQFREGGQVNFRSSNAKAFKRAIIDRHSLRFAPELSFGEDKLFNLEYALQAENFVYLPVPVYFCETRAGSLTSSFRPNVLDELIALIEKSQTILEQHDLPSSTKQTHSDYVLDHIAYALCEIIFNPLHPISRQKRYAMCADLRKKLRYHPALRQNSWIGPLERRIFLFFFRLGWYRTTHMLYTAARLRWEFRERRAAASKRRKEEDGV